MRAGVLSFGSGRRRDVDAARTLPRPGPGLVSLVVPLMTFSSRGAYLKRPSFPFITPPFFPLFDALFQLARLPYRRPLYSLAPSNPKTGKPCRPASFPPPDLGQKSGRASWPVVGLLTETAPEDAGAAEAVSQERGRSCMHCVRREAGDHVVGLLRQE